MSKQKRLALIAFLLVTFTISAQGEAKKKRAFMAAVDSLNQIIDAYDSIPTFFHDDYERLEMLTAEMDKRLIRLLDNPLMAKQHPEELFHKGINVSHSMDKRLYFLTYHEKNGGTQQMLRSFYFIRLPDGTSTSGEMEGMSFGNIYTIDHEPLRYLIFSSNILCQTCLEMFAMIATIDSSDWSLNHNERISFEGRFGDLLELRYDTTSQEITLRYTTDSRDSLYGSDPYSGEEDEKTKPDYYLHESYLEKYRYDGKAFYPIKSCHETERRPKE